MISFSKRLIDFASFFAGFVLLPAVCFSALGKESKAPIESSSGWVALPCTSCACLQELDSSIRMVGLELLFLVERLPLPSVSVTSLIVFSVFDLLPPSLLPKSWLLSRILMRDSSIF